MFDPHVLAEHIDQSLDAGTSIADPFRVFVYKPYPDDLYSAIRTYLPPDEFFLPIRHPDARRPDGTSTRLVLMVKPERTAAMPPEQRDFWMSLHNVLFSDAVRDVYVRRFEPELVK